MRSLFFAVLLTHMLSMTTASATPLSRFANSSPLASFASNSSPLASFASNSSPLASFAKLRATVEKWLRKLPSQALQSATAAGTAIIIACSGLTMTGCDQGRSVLDVTNTEYIDPSDENAGQYVTFYIENQLYEGYWEVTPDGQLLIEVDDGYDKIVLLEYMTGRVINNHPDLGAEVVVQGLRNGRAVDKYGTVGKVFDNGLYLIDIDEIVYVHNNLSIYSRETLLASPDVLPEDGGLEFLDE